MKQLVILSGKGGTGKTSLAASFAHLACAGPLPARAVLADADVDAANLELVLRPEHREPHDFTGASVAMIDPERCQGCGICEQACRFDAIYSFQATSEMERWPLQSQFLIDPIACEGCAACMYQCPEMAISMQPQIAGRWFRSESRYGPLFHAELFPAQENSGKLVTLVKQHARLCALDGGYDLLLVDGPPGVGCPVIAAAAGAHLALIVTEPTLAGIHDLERTIQTTTHFNIPTQVIINKADLYPEGATHITILCDERGIPVLGHIPFDPAVSAAMAQGDPVTAWRPESPASRSIQAAWERLANFL